MPLLLVVRLRLTGLLGIAAFLMIVPLIQASPTIYDLAADWSFASNPNAVWSYNEGSNPLPLQNPWSPSDPNSPPGWAYAQWPNFGHVPVWSRVTNAPQFVADTQTGDVVVHSSDSGRGENNGPANVTWTSPSAGTITISGSAWIDRLADRSNKWSLYLNGALLSSGNMFAGGGYYRSTPFDFSTGSGGAAILTNIPVAAGDVVKLEIVKLSTYGSFAGVNLQIIFTSTAQTCVAAPPGLVAWWPGDGNANDIAGTNHGTLQNGSTFMAGMVGQAFGFNSSGHYVSVPDSSSLDLGVNQTLDMWVFPTANPSGNYAPLIAKKEVNFSGIRPYGLWMSPSGAFLFQIIVGGTNCTQNGAGCCDMEAGTIPLNTWSHLAASYDGASQKIYKNGALIGSRACTLVPPATLDPLWMGYDLNHTQFFGKVDEVELFNRTLSASEIQAIFNAGSAGKCKAITDMTPPLITPTVNGTVGTNGWYRSNVAVNWSVTDPESGIASSNGCSPMSFLSDTPGTSLTCSATNGAGLSSSQLVTIKIDQTAPQISITTPGTGPYTVNAPLTASYGCSDAGSGITACSGPVANGATFTTSQVNSNTFSVNATDAAGNTLSKTATYKVQYDFRGFFQPTDNLPTLNVVNAGRVIPIKWQLLDANGLPISDLTSLTSTGQSAVPCDASPVDAIEETVAPGSTVFRYESTVNQFIYNWQTDPAWAGTCRIFQITLKDGNVKQAKFQFK